GLTVNAIIYDGVLRRDDLIVIGGKEKPIVTRVRAILVPKPLDEIRDPRDRFTTVESVSAAAGVKIVAPDLEGVLAGAPLYAVAEGESPDDYIRLVAEEIERIRIATDTDGVVLKADTLGSLEAIAEHLRRNNIPIRLADVGDVSKRDVTEASVVKEHEPLYGVVLAFNVKVLPDAEEEAKSKGVKIFQEKVIYHLIDNYLSWFKSQREARIEQEFASLIKPAKIRILEGYVFRRAKPAIVGVEVLAGKIMPKLTLIRAEDGEDIGEIMQIQDKGQAIPEANQGMQVAISLNKPIVGRHIFENDVLYVKVPEAHAKLLLEKFFDKLTPEEQEVLKEYIELRKKNIPFWGL
ncbi:MAG: EF-Tu/IF-2/RF-3 family GTPase, partial [Candidatus Bathyarchaeia archaeon]